jgi:predicted NBD/HSP70 family sugar kinase
MKISNALFYNKIVRFFIHNGNSTNADLSKELMTSIPTTAKLVGEMCDMGFVDEFGKMETNEGRRPILYGLNPDSAYFVGIDTMQDSLNIALMDFRGDLVELSMNQPFDAGNTPEGIDSMAAAVHDFLSKVKVDIKKIKAINLNISGRVNSEKGYSYSWWNFSEAPLTDILTEKFGYTTFIDNDSRAMTYGEYMKGDINRVKNLIFVNLGWGLGMGIIIDGKLYLGKSGFSGELGHVHLFDNEILCRCGKKGCLETEASGQAFCRKISERLRNGEASLLQKYYKKDAKISLQQAIEATLREDVLCAEVVEQMGNLLGEQLAGIINIFNPEALVIGGLLSQIGDVLIHHVNTGIMKYSLNLVSQDTQVCLSRLREKAGVVGACMLARKNVLEHELLY